MPTISNKIGCVDHTNLSGPSLGEHPVFAVREELGALTRMLEDFRQRLQFLEDKQTDSEATLQEFNARQQVLQESLHSLQRECRELHNLATPPVAPLTLGNPLEQRRSRPSAQERLRIGATAGSLHVGTEELYPFHASIWDIAIFIGTPCLGLGGSMITCSLLLMNIMMQVVFVGIVWSNFSNATMNETTVRAAQRWRESEAHAYRNMDLQSGLSLVARVCQSDKSLQVASSQESLYNFVTDYLKPGATGLETLFVGKVLCTVALVCWFLMVSKELSKAVDLFRGMMFLDRGPFKLVPTEQFGHPTTFRIKSISWRRMTFSGMILSYRLILSGLLAYSGTYFLVYTIETTELILNAVALEIILSIDDLLFDAATTANAKYLVMKLDPLSMSRWPHGRGADLKAVSTAIIIPGAALLVYSTMISPMVDTLNEVAHALCGGATDFVFSDDELKMTYFAQTQAHQMPTSVQTLAIREVVQKGLHNRSEYALLVGGSGDAHDLFRQVSRQFESAVDGFSKGVCVDNLQGPYLHYMRQIMGNLSISHCNDVKSWCSSASFVPEWGPDGGKGLMARLLCPHTCECDLPGGSIAFITGCPPACALRSHPFYAQSLNTSNTPSCSQKGAADLVNSSDWMAWKRQLESWSLFKKDHSIRVYASDMRNGCANLLKQPVAPNCIWEGQYNAAFKSIAFFCPEECKCKGGGFKKPPSCPDACLNNGPGQKPPWFR